MLKIPGKCKRHGLYNCPNPQCNPHNKSNEIIEQTSRKIKNMKIKKIKKPDDTKDS